MKKVLLFLIVMFFITGCSSLRVNVDYDPNFDVKAQKTFAIVHYTNEGEDTLFNDRFTDALAQDLIAKGYAKENKNSADLIFVFHVNVESKTDIHTDYTMVGYGGYGYGGQMMATTRTYKYTKGTLVLDALNPKDEKIVYRMIATDTLKTYDNPEERTKYVKILVNETMKDFPSKVVSQ